MVGHGQNFGLNWTVGLHKLRDKKGRTAGRSRPCPAEEAVPDQDRSWDQIWYEPDTFGTGGQTNDIPVPN